MGVRSARITDIFSIRALDTNASAQVFSSLAAGRRADTLLMLLAGWRSMGQRSLTLVLRGPDARGFVQACAQHGRESWDLARLVCLAADEQAWERGVDVLVDRACALIAQRGALRAFARASSEDRVALLAEHGFRAYATEQTLAGALLPLVERAHSPATDVRARQAHDTWDIFSLYSHIVPALVRYAEGHTLREWMQARQQPDHVGRRRPAPHEAVMGEPGNLVAWLRWVPAGKSRPQQLEVLIRPECVDRLGELVRYAAQYCDLDPFTPTLCRIREYDGRISGTLEEAGFEPVARETLLVRHFTAQVTERQLLIAAVRAQGLGIDISRYRRGAEPAHQRLASSGEAEHHYYDRDCRTSSYR